MPTYVLDDSTPVRLAAGPLRLSAQCTSGEVRVDVRGDDDIVVVRPTAELVIVPRLRRRTRVVVSSVTSPAAFPAGSSVSLSLLVEGVATHDPERVQLPAVDVSGLASIELLVVEPVGDSLEVFATGLQQDQAMPALVGRSRAAARTLLGVDRVPDQYAVQVVVAVDGSASMRRSARAGELSDVLDFLLGVAGVISSVSDPPRAAVVHRSLRWLSAGSPGRFAGDVVTSIVQGPDVIGFRSADPALRGLAPEENVVVFVVTDGIPADVEVLAADNQVEGEARHLVLLNQEDDPTRPAGRAGSLPVTRVPSRLAAAGATPWADPLNDVVRSLLTGCFAEGSKLDQRLAR